MSSANNLTLMLSSSLFSTQGLVWEECGGGEGMGVGGRVGGPSGGWGCVGVGGVGVSCERSTLPGWRRV